MVTSKAYSCLALTFFLTTVSNLSWLQLLKQNHPQGLFTAAIGASIALLFLGGIAFGLARSKRRFEPSTSKIALALLVAQLSTTLLSGLPAIASELILAQSTLIAFLCNVLVSTQIAIVASNPIFPFLRTAGSLGFGIGFVLVSCNFGIELLSICAATAGVLLVLTTSQRDKLPTDYSTPFENVNESDGISFGIVLVLSTCVQASSTAFQSFGLVTSLSTVTGVIGVGLLVCCEFYLLQRTNQSTGWIITAGLSWVLVYAFLLASKANPLAMVASCLLVAPNCCAQTVLQSSAQRRFSRDDANGQAILITVNGLAATIISLIYATNPNGEIWWYGLATAIISFAILSIVLAVLYQKVQIEKRGKDAKNA